MSLFEDPFKSKPDFVNTDGVKWWLDKGMTQYAKTHLEKTSYAHSIVWLVEEANGHRSRLLVCDGKILREYPSYEGMACWIDAIKLSETMK